MFSADLFQNRLSGKILLGILNECQTDWIQICKMSGLILVLSVHKASEQTMLVGNELICIPQAHANVSSQIRPDKMSALTWIQSV